MFMKKLLFHIPVNMVEETKRVFYLHISYHTKHFELVCRKPPSYKGAQDFSTLRLFALSAPVQIGTDTIGAGQIGTRTDRLAPF